MKKFFAIALTIALTAVSLVSSKSATAEIMRRSLPSSVVSTTATTEKTPGGSIPRRVTFIYESRNQNAGVQVGRPGSLEKFLEGVEHATTPGGAMDRALGIVPVAVPTETPPAPEETPEEVPETPEETPEEAPEAPEEIRPDDTAPPIRETVRRRVVHRVKTRRIIRRSRPANRGFEAIAHR